MDCRGSIDEGCLCGPGPSFIYSIHVPPPPPPRRGEWPDKAGTALALKASLSAPSSLHPSSALVSHLSSLGSSTGTVISQSLAMILAFHVSQDFTSDESMCSAGPCALRRKRPDAPAASGSLQGSGASTKRTENFVPSGLTDLLLMRATPTRARRRKCNQKKTTFDTQNANPTDALLGFRTFRI